MAINPVGSTNLLSKYISAQNAASPALPAISAANASLPAVSASVTPRTKEQDLIEKQKRLIKLQNDKINSLQTQKTQKPQSSSQGIVGTILSIIGGITLVNFLFNYRSPAKMRAEMQHLCPVLRAKILQQTTSRYLNPTSSLFLNHLLISYFSPFKSINNYM